MPLPDRPVSNTTIESAWGQAVHDWVFAPSGCEASGNDTTVSTSVTQLTIDTAVEDPGGYVDTAGNDIEVPTDRAGLYSMSARFWSTSGVDTNRTRCFIKVNGAEVIRSIEENQTGGTIVVALQTHERLTAGDIITFHAQKVGSGSNLGVKLKQFIMVRVGNEIGA